MNKYLQRFTKPDGSTMTTEERLQWYKERDRQQTEQARRAASNTKPETNAARIMLAEYQQALETYSHGRVDDAKSKYLAERIAYYEAQAGRIDEKHKEADRQIAFRRSVQQAMAQVEANKNLYTDDELSILRIRASLDPNPDPQVHEQFFFEALAEIEANVHQRLQEKSFEARGQELKTAAESAARELTMLEQTQRLAQAQEKLSEVTE